MIQLHPGSYFVSLHLADVYRNISRWYGKAQYPLPGVLVIGTWACRGRNKWIGVGLGFWILPCQIPAGILMHRFLDSLLCEFIGPLGSSFELIARQLGPNLETLYRTVVSWCIPTDFCGGTGLCSWSERAVSYCRRPNPP